MATDRMVGESYKDACARLYGQAQAAEIDRDAARAQVAELAEEAGNARAHALVEQTNFKGMTVEEGVAVLDLEPPRALVIAWVDAARKMLGDAPNYSETRIDFPVASMEVRAAGELERYVFTVQRAGKVTPHEARVAAEIDRDRYAAQVSGLERERDRAWAGLWAAVLPNLDADSARRIREEIRRLIPNDTEATS